MAGIGKQRMLDPSAAHEDYHASVSPLARVVRLVLPCFVDREGRVEDRPDVLRGLLLPYDTKADMSSILDELVKANEVTRYSVEGVSVVALRCKPSCHANERESTLPEIPSNSEKFIPHTVEVRHRNGHRNGNGNNQEGSVRGAPIDTSWLMALWNELAPPVCPRCERWTTERKRKAAARVKDEPDQERWAAGIRQIAKSRFLMGGGERGWKADMAWLLKPDTLTKLLEGGYDDTAPPAEEPIPPSPMKKVDMEGDLKRWAEEDAAKEREAQADG